MSLKPWQAFDKRVDFSVRRFEWSWFYSIQWRNKRGVFQTDIGQFVHPPTKCTKSTKVSNKKRGVLPWWPPPDPPLIAPNERKYNVIYFIVIYLPLKTYVCTHYPLKISNDMICNDIERNSLFCQFEQYRKIM